MLWIAGEVMQIAKYWLKNNIANESGSYDEAIYDISVRAYTMRTVKIVDFYRNIALLFGTFMAVNCSGANLQAFTNHSELTVIHPK